ncbi:hypothetical protein N008_21495 (plasmid) [Hymenobacter sp. APR13]|nr:hypothetical protein N008_21495 [Hymenobacter sp. APR13]
MIRALPFFVATTMMIAWGLMPAAFVALGVGFGFR